MIVEETSPIGTMATGNSSTSISKLGGQICRQRRHINLLECTLSDVNNNNNKQSVTMFHAVGSLQLPSDISYSQLTDMYCLQARVSHCIVMVISYPTSFGTPGTKMLVILYAWRVPNHHP